MTRSRHHSHETPPRDAEDADLAVPLLTAAISGDGALLESLMDEALETCPDATMTALVGIAAGLAIQLGPRLGTSTDRMLGAVARARLSVRAREG